MALFVDASAIVAILREEHDAANMLLRLEYDEDRLYSSMVEWETVAALSRDSDRLGDLWRGRVRSFLDAFGFRPVVIAEMETAQALDAFDRYGKGRHPAALNIGDCFAYACAKTDNASLLYKGNDFAWTDLA